MLGVLVIREIRGDLGSGGVKWFEVQAVLQDLNLCIANTKSVWNSAWVSRIGGA